MSGGTFDYMQYRLYEIAQSIEHIIENNNKEDEYGYKTQYSQQTLDKFKEGVKLLRQAEVYAQRIDWLCAGDDGEETFHQRLEEDLNILKEL